MNHLEIARLEHASRAVMAYVPDDRPPAFARLAAAAIPALGILVACAIMLLTIV